MDHIETDRHNKIAAQHRVLWDDEESKRCVTRLDALLKELDEADCTIKPVLDEQCGLIQRATQEIKEQEVALDNTLQQHQRTMLTLIVNDVTPSMIPIGPWITAQAEYDEIKLQMAQQVLSRAATTIQATIDAIDAIKQHRQSLVVKRQYLDSLKLEVPVHECVVVDDNAPFPPRPFPPRPFPPGKRLTARRAHVSLPGSPSRKKAKPSHK